MHPALILASAIFTTIFGAVLGMVALATVARLRSASHRYHARLPDDPGDE